MPEDVRRRIAKRAAMELGNGDLVNLGVGIPVMVADFLSAEQKIFFHAENGIVGLGPSPTEEQFDPFIINAGRKPATVVPGASFTDSAMSFGIIRGGHLDVTIIGALQVSQNGDIANWVLPGKDILGMGGAMDLVVGANKVIVVMQHTSPSGEPKILAECNIPLTAPASADMLITEYAVFRFDDGKMLLEEICSGMTLEELKRMTPADYAISPKLKLMDC